MLIRSRAPLRISFAGGGTDVSPYCDEREGAVISTTIDRYAFCTLSPRTDREISIRSLDYGKEEKWEANGMFQYDGNLDLIKAVLNHFDVKQGVDMFLHCDAPPGSGLGGSSTVIVSILGAVTDWLNQPMTQYELAKLAYDLERKELGFKGGRQDQYASVFGGFNYMEFRKEDTIVTPLRIKPNILNELQYNTLLCYTGRTRDGGTIINDQTKGYIDRDVDVIAALDNTKRLAKETKEALMKGEIHKMGELLDESWKNKKKFTGKITNERVDKIYETAINNGAIGGKITGAGGGGYMFFICEYDKKHIVANELAKLDVHIAHFNFDEHGLQTWRYNK